MIEIDMEGIIKDEAFRMTLLLLIFTTIITILKLRLD